MGGVLIDDDHAVGGFSDNVCGVELRPGCTQRVGFIRGDIVFRQPRRRGEIGIGEGNGWPFGKSRPRCLEPCGGRKRKLTTTSEGIPAAAETTWSRRPQHCNAGGGGCSVPGLGQGMAQSTHDQAAHQGGIAESHFGLGGVDIHIDPFRTDFQKQRQHGVAIPGQQILICSTHGPQQQTVAYGPAVHK